MKNIVLYLCVFFSILSCEAQKSKNFDLIQYRFSDSSVEARFHRSYTIFMAENGKGKIYVYAYGDTLTQKDFEISKSQFEELQKLAPKIEPAGKKVNEGMSGTSRQTIQLTQGKKSVYQLIWDNKNTVSKDTEHFVFLLKKYTPELQKLLSIEHDVHTSVIGQESETAEQIQILELKRQLFENKDPKKEKDILFKIWQSADVSIVRKSADEPHIHLGLSIKDENGKSVHINKRKQGSTAHISLRAVDAKVNTTLWTIEFDYTPLDMNNIAVLMRE